MPDAVPVRGLFEAHLTVSDLERSIRFYREVVGLRPALEAPDRGAAFLWCGEPGASMLVWSTGSAPMNMVLHLAFDVALADLHEAVERLESRGVAPLSFFGEPVHEPSVIGWMPGAAV